MTFFTGKISYTKRSELMAGYRSQPPTHNKEMTSNDTQWKTVNIFKSIYDICKGSDKFIGILFV